jgi:hypothetical protein
VIDSFIKLSQAGMDKGAHIMHRIHGSTTDIQGSRAVTKMKATITQRFNLHGVEVDAVSDCRFAFFWDKRGDKWGAQFVRHWYEKDKLLPVDPRKVPELDDEKLAKFPPGYRYLGYCQEEVMGVKVKLDMPGHRSQCDPAHDKLYWQTKQWLEGENVEI